MKYIRWAVSHLFYGIGSVVGWLYQHVMYLSERAQGPSDFGPWEALRDAYESEEEVLDA